MKSFKQYLEEQSLLIESRLDFLKKKYEEIGGVNISHDQLADKKNVPDIVDHFSENADPTKKKIYTQWILDRYHKGDFRQEDSRRIHSAMSNFDRYKQRLENKDINSYKDLSSIESAIEPHIGTAYSKNEEIRQIKDDGADLIHDNEDVSVHKIKTKEAACEYGSNTKWCTAARVGQNLFDSYNQKGPLYVIRTKGDNKKYQFHFETRQFMNDQDKQIDLPKFFEEHPSLKTEPEFSGKHFLTTSEDKLDHMIKNADQYKSDSAEGKMLHDIAYSGNEKRHLIELSSRDTFDHQLIANQNTPKEALKNIANRLSNKENANLGGLYAHKNSTLDIQNSIVDKIDPSVILDNGKSPAHHVASVYNGNKSNSRDYTTKALLHPNAPVEIHDDAIKHPTWHAALSKSKSARPEHLEQLARSEFAFVRKNVAENKKTPKETLEILKNDPESSVREAASKKSK